MTAVRGSIALTAVMGLVLVVVAWWVSTVEDWRTYAPAGSVGDGAPGGGYGDPAENREKPGGIVRWLTTVDHRDVGILYGAYAVVAFAWGGVAVLLMRIELLFPGTDFLDPATYNALLTSHGITMLFLFGTPMIAAIANYVVPLLIGADDMAFPRINAIAFWLLPPGALLVWGGILLDPFAAGIEGAQTAWTLYPPLSAEQTNPGVDLMLIGLHLTGVSATMGAINFVVTIVTERADDVGWDTLDIFSWTILTQSGLVIFAFPLLGSALVMLLMDRNLGTTFFTAEGGGTILWQHLFWFFGHPEVYILVLPPMGLVSYIIPRFSGRKLFGFKFVVYSTLALGVLSFGVWAHHMFTTGIDPRLRASFMVVSIAIAIPSAVKTFNWITTMWGGRLRLTTPMLFCVGFVFNFIIGGVTGVFEAAIPIDLLLHDTYHVVAHFHYVVMGAIGFALFAAVYYWFPLVTGRMYARTLGKWHFWLSMVGTNVTFFPMIMLGYGGMPRRYATYDLSVGPVAYFTDLHQIATLGAVMLAVGQVIFVWNVVQSWLEAPTVDDGDPWDLAADGVKTREWGWFERTTVGPLDDGSERVDASDRDVGTDSTDGELRDESDGAGGSTAGRS